MKNKSLLVLLIMIILITGCKNKGISSKEIDIKTEPDKKVEVKKESDKGPDIDEDIKTLLNKLGGAMPKTPLKYDDAGLADLNGKTLKLSDYEGQLIFLNLWATWCPPCRAEMPSMEKLYQKYKKKDFVIIAVAMGENLKTVKKFLKSKDYTFPIFTDSNGDVSKNYSTQSIPTSYLIGRDGNIIARFVGGRDWFGPEANELIEKL